MKTEMQQALALKRALVYVSQPLCFKILST